MTENAASAIRLVVLCAAGFLFTPGRFLFGSYPFGVALIAAVSGVYSAPAALAGALFGALRINGGAIGIPVLAALLLGRTAVCVVLDSDRPRNVGGKGIKRLVARAGDILSGCAAARYDESVYIRMAMASVASLAGGVLLVASDPESASFAPAVASSVLSPLFVRLFCSSSLWMKVCPDGAVRERSAVLREAGTAALCTALALSLHAIRIPVVDPGAVCVFVLTLLTVRKRGIPIGALRGFLVGAALSPDVASVSVVCAVAYGLLANVSDAGSVAASAAAGVAWGYRLSGLDVLTGVLPDLIVCVAVATPAFVFGIVPRAARKRGTPSSDRSSRDEVREARARERTGKKLADLSAGLSSVSQELYRISGEAGALSGDEIRSLCERGFRSVCDGCGMRRACYEEEASEVRRVKEEMAAQLERDGRVSASAVSRPLAGRCYNVDIIIDGINSSYAKAVAQGRIFDRTAVVASDYEAVAEMLKDAAAEDESEYRLDAKLTREVTDILPSRGFFAESVAVFGKRRKTVSAAGVDLGRTALGSDEIRALFGSLCDSPLSAPSFSITGDTVNMRLDPVPRLTARIGEASRAAAPSPGGEEKKPGKSEACGDVIKTFETDEGRIFMMISDGMGSGKEAEKTAHMCAAFLEKMLTSGAAAGTAMKMLNSLIRARGTECSATVDLMEIDLMTGRAKFIKSGAAPSFVIRGGRLFRLQSKTVPIGIIRALDAEMISFDIEPGDVVVMVSDGVARSFEEAAWLCDLLTEECAEAEPRETAEKIVRLAAQGGSKDDITAGIVKLSRAC